MIDTVVIGAGPSGLCAAKTILQCDPTAEVRILDAGSTVGGVWAKEKIYPTLKTNHYFGGLDFSDFRMPIAHGAQPDDHIPGIAVHEFLKSYADHFRLNELIQFKTTVGKISRIDGGGGWKLDIISPNRYVIECKKLIVGMGVNNRPHRPRFEGVSDFDAPLIHSSELGPNTDLIIQNPSTKTVAILGGGKSAYDAVHMAVSAGKEVEWIMRKSGKGPVWIFPMETKMGPFTSLREKMPVRRFVSFFSPCIWNDGFRWFRDLLHASKIGQLIMQLFWTKMYNATLEDCGYRKDERLRLLEPEHGPFWYGTTGGSCKYLPELWEHVRQGRIRVHRQDISHLSKRTIYLANGQKLPVDILITATGFSAKPTMKFSPASSHCELGLPSSDLNLDQQKFWASLDLQSDLKLSKQFPNLVRGPNKHAETVQPPPTDIQTDPEANYSPFRLYRSIAPPGLTAEGDRSLVFLGVFSNFANMARLEIQCLWAYAYLNNKLSIDPRTVYEEASMLSRFSRYRTPLGHGSYFPDHVFDQLPYFDTLLKDLGVRSRRKEGFFKELFDPYCASDYKNMIPEWLSRQKRKV